MAQDILITPGSGEPQILFRGSGTNDTPIELNVLSSYQSASSSGSALLFEGTEGQLFAITDNLSSGVIFSVAGAAGLPFIEADASGDVRLIEYGRYVGVGTGTPAYQLDVFGTGRFSNGIMFGDGTTQTTAGGGGGSTTGTASGVAFFGGDNNLTESTSFTFDSGNKILNVFGTGTEYGTLKLGENARWVCRNGAGISYQSSTSNFPVLFNSHFSVILASNTDFGWSANSSDPFGATIDTIISRDAAGTVGFYKAGGSTYGTINVGNMVIDNPTSSNVNLVVKGAAAQSENLQEWQDSAGSAYSFIDQTGALHLGTGSTTYNYNLVVTTGDVYIRDSLYVGEERNKSSGSNTALIELTSYSSNKIVFNSHNGWSKYQISSAINGALTFDNLSTNSANLGFAFKNSVGTATYNAQLMIQDGIGFGNGAGNVQGSLLGSTFTATNKGSRTHDLQLTFRQSTHDGSQSGRFIFTKEGDFSATGNINALYGTVTASSGVFNTGEIEKLTVDNGTASALNVSGTTLMAGTGVILDVQSTGGTTLFAVEDTTETTLVVNSQNGQTSHPFEVRDAFGLTAASIDVSGNISGNHISFGDGTTQTTAAVGGTPGGSNTQVQFNDGGSFSGDPNFTWDKSADKLTISVNHTDDALLLTSTETGSSASPVLTFKRDSSSPDDGDYLGQLKFKGESDTSAERIYAKITAKILDATNGTEDGLIEYAVREDGSNKIMSRFRGDGIRVLNGAHFIAETDSKVGVGNTNPTYQVDVVGTGNFTGGVRFPDGNVQTTAAGPASVISDTGTAITMVCATHANNYLRTTANSAVTITFPSGLGCDANSEFTFEQAGSGQITVTGAAGVTINTSSTTKSYTQFSVISMKQVATDTYTLFGDTASF